MKNWYGTNGPDNDVVLFSKVRLARNLSDTPFKSKLSNEINIPINVMRRIGLMDKLVIPSNAKETIFLNG